MLRRPSRPLKPTNRYTFPGKAYNMARKVVTLTFRVTFSRCVLTVSVASYRSRNPVSTAQERYVATAIGLPESYDWIRSLSMRRRGRGDGE